MKFAVCFIKCAETPLQGEWMVAVEEALVGTGGSISGAPHPSTTPSQLGGGIVQKKYSCVRSGQFWNLQILPTSFFLQIMIKGTISKA